MNSLVVESGPSGGPAFGPILASEEAACLGCVAARRHAASGTAVGVLRTVAISGDALPASVERLAEHQLWFGPGGLAGDRFLPLPQCRCPRTRGGTRRRAEGDLEELVGSRLGLIRRVWEFHGVPGLVTAVAEGAPLTGTSGLPVLAQGTATASDRAVARRLAIVEALERYAAGFWQESDLRLVGAVPMVEASRHDDGARVWVPASRVYLPFDEANAGGSSGASGLAAGSSLADATDRAVAERVERNVIGRFLDGDVGTRRLPAPADDVPDADLHAGAIDVLLACAQGHYVCAALVAGGREVPHATIGFGAARRLEQALAKARAERLHVEAHMRRLAGEKPVRLPAEASTVDRLVHGLAFGSPDALLRAAGLAAAPFLRRPPTLRGDTRGLAIVDVTTSDLRRFGLSVVRAVNLSA
jgi:hypothetical protein